MKAITSFYTPPMLGGAANPWKSPYQMLACAQQSILRASKHYDVLVYTDYLGHELLRAMGVPCAVDTCLEGVFDNVPLALWHYPKVVAYSKQREPFFHFDLDCLINEPLPDWFLKAQMGFQSNEEPHPSFYNLHETRQHYEWRWPTTPDLSPNMGVYVCNDLPLNNLFCSASLGFVEMNHAELYDDSLPKPNPCVLEQYLMGAICRGMGVPWSTLLYPGQSCLTKGYYHLVGALKRDSMALTPLLPYVGSHGVSDAVFMLNEAASKSLQLAAQGQ